MSHKTILISIFLGGVSCFETTTDWEGSINIQVRQDYMSHKSCDKTAQLTKFLYAEAILVTKFGY